MDNKTVQNLVTTVSPDSQDLFVNRELSWLEFNKRVLSEAADSNVPLLERLKFLSIYFSNLDEFFMVRVGSLGDQIFLEPNKTDELTGWNAQRQVEEIFKRVKEISPLAEQYYQTILRELSDEGIDMVDCKKLSKLEELMLSKKFAEEIKPLLSPQIIDRHHPFPFLNNKEQYIAAVFESKGDHLKIGIVPTAHLPPFLVFRIEKRQKVAMTADIVCHFLSKLYQKQKINEKYILRITRNADMTMDEAYLDYEIDFRGVMKELLKKRKRQAVVRVQTATPLSGKFQEYLLKRLAIEQDQILPQPLPLDFGFGFSLAQSLELPDRRLFFQEVRPFQSVDLSRKNAIKLLSTNDLLLAYPFQSIKPFLDLLLEAADDPTVVSIKISLYRLANHSKIASALMRAAENGKEVICVLELRARFDEQSNIDYASLLEEAGCTLIYGLGDYKIHAKLCLITRLVHGKISYITQVGTGNFNEKTAELYTDLALITGDEGIGRDAGEIFSALCLGEIPERMVHLWVAPLGFKSDLVELIQQQIARQREFGDGYIAMKVNSMNDTMVMQALVEASQAGVPVDLFIRGICCLRPSVTGYTENIRIRSIIGRYLEHSRIFVFGQEVNCRVFIGSGDLLNRNTTRRVEIFTEVKSVFPKEQLLIVMKTLEADNRRSWKMYPDGSYQKDRSGEIPLDCQQHLQQHFAQFVELSEPKQHFSEKAKGFFSWFKRK